MSFGSRLKEQRERLGLTQTQLAKLLKVTKGAIGNYETGTSSPKAEILYKLFDILQCDANYLFQDEISNGVSDNTFSKSEITHIKKYRALDRHGKDVVDVVLDKETERMQTLAQQAQIEEADDIITVDFASLKASAGKGFQLFDDCPSDKLKVLYNEKTRQADICIQVSGHSMEPVFNNDDILLVRKQPSVDIGEYGIFIINNNGFVKKQGTDRLISVNDDFDDIYPSEFDDIRCYGKVVGTLAKEWVVE